MQPLIVLGDKTSHGGTVIAASPFSDTHGKPIARVGDMVACPRCKGVFPIIEGDKSLIVDGAAAAYHGCKAACGATLICGQMFTLTSPSGRAGSASSGSDAGDNGRDGIASIGQGLAASYDEQTDPNDAQRYRGRLQLLNEATDEPIAGRSVRIRTTDGRLFTSSTDGEGYTAWIERNAGEALAFDLPDEDNHE